MQELCTSSFIPLEVFMILVSIGMAVQCSGGQEQSYLPIAVAVQYARYHEMVPKMMYVQR